MPLLLAVAEAAVAIGQDGIAGIRTVLREAYAFDDDSPIMIALDSMGAAIAPRLRQGGKNDDSR